MRSWNRLLICLAASGALIGCSKSPEIEFTLREKTANVKEPLLGEIQAALARYNGTPQSPRMLGQASVKTSHLKHGQAVYQKRCAQCHGDSGDGMGPAAAAMYPKPRDYRRGIFKFVSTPYGSKPRREDLELTLYRGISGTSMPGFKFLSKQDLTAVIDYILVLTHRGELEWELANEAEYMQEDLDAFAEDLKADFGDLSGGVDDLVAYLDDESDSFPEDELKTYRERLSNGPVPPVDQVHSQLIKMRARKMVQSYAADSAELIITQWNEAKGLEVHPVTPMPDLTIENVRAGKEAFLTKGCSKCHGEDGRGQTKENLFVDSWGNPTRAADLTSGFLHGGSRPIDIYRRIYGGINGTPMPNFKNALGAEPDTFWNLVSYVKYVSNRRRNGVLPPSGELSPFVATPPAEQADSQPATGTVVAQETAQ